MEYELTIETRPTEQAATLRLCDEHGQQKGFHELTLAAHRPALWEGVFDTRQHVKRYKDSQQWADASAPETEEQILTRLGVFLGTEVLGPAIMQALTSSHQRRSLLVKLPATTNDLLAAAFARVPWEIARTAPDQPPLMERNVVVRVTTADTLTRDQAVLDMAAKVKQGETLRVLLVFAEAPGSRPLAMRHERQELLDLFYTKILPKKRVQVDVLCHGVTRAALTEQIAAANGYHIVHWSGHGHYNSLQLLGDGGQAGYLSGEDFTTLFQQAGGFMPHLVFLSACLSGTFVEIKQWSEFQALLLGQEPAHKQADAAPGLSKMLENPAGYTGTALALLRCGVPQVIAMRYNVGDAYARRLAVQFYQRLLADPAQTPTEGALASARGDLLRDAALAQQLGAVNHATPLMFGQPGRLLDPVHKRSAQMKFLRPKPQPLLPGKHELDAPEHFVGRGAELTRLNVEWLGSNGPAVALVQGLAGMGKTALAAEVIHLWFRKFDYVFAFQAKPTALTIDEFSRQFDARLALESQTYREKCDDSPYSKIYLEPGQPLSGAARYQKMRENLLEVLRDEALLLVLDNFETNLDRRYNCQEPEWDALLRLLTEELPDTRSRLLLTSRHRPAVLEEQTLRVLLGPLSLRSGEAGLFVGTHPAFQGLLNAGPSGLALLQRLMAVTRGHPLILNRLAALAHDPAALTQALDSLQQQGWHTLPDLFAAARSDTEQEAERTYLEEVAIGSIDLLIERLAADARHLLWLITIANEPVTAELLAGVVADLTPQPPLLKGEGEQDDLTLQPPLLKGEGEQDDLTPQPPLLKGEGEPHLPSPLRRGAGGEVSDLRKGAGGEVSELLANLTETGLIGREDLEDADRMQALPTALQYSFHELVRERMAAWMQAHPAERAGRVVEQVWVAYGERYAAMFEQLRRSGREGAMEAASEAGRRGLTYLARAKAFDKLGPFASGLVTGTRDPALLRSVIAELQAVADQVPAGEDRWTLRTNLADALASASHPDQGLALYAQAAAEAEAAQHWADVAWICGNWANALLMTGQLEQSKTTHLRSADAHRKAGNPEINVIGRELEALRIDVYQGRAAAALPEIEVRVQAVRGWWQRSRHGAAVPEAPDAVVLGWALVSGLDIAREANQQLQRWETCLSLLQESEQTERDTGASRHEQYRTRFNQYTPLMSLGRLDDAQRVLEECLTVFREMDAVTEQSTVLSALAAIWDARDDVAQAIALERQALSICNRLPDPADRAMSHGNLSIYLEKAGKDEDAVRHELATGIYFLIATRHDQLSNWLRNLGIRIRNSDGHHTLPRVADLLARPEFAALQQFVEQWRVDAAQLQAQVDELAAQARG